MTHPGRTGHGSIFLRLVCRVQHGISRFPHIVAGRTHHILQLGEQLGQLGGHGINLVGRELHLAGSGFQHLGGLLGQLRSPLLGDPLHPLGAAVSLQLGLTGHGGFGLGLAIARAIVQNHRGNIICRSQEGLNRFSVTLPILRQKGAQ